jgi:CubicO group peptidase (beta-lactamase class C family)
MKQAAVVVFIFLLAGSPLFAQTVAGPAPMDSASVRVITERYALPYIRDPKHVGLSIGILYAGHRYTYNYGVTDKASRRLPTSRSIYEIASVTKTYTGILLAHAVIEKKLGLQDDIRIYLPGTYHHRRSGQSYGGLSQIYPALASGCYTGPDQRGICRLFQSPISSGACDTRARYPAGEPV